MEASHTAVELGFKEGGLRCCDEGPDVGGADRRGAVAETAELWSPCQSR